MIIIRNDTYIPYEFANINNALKHIVSRCHNIKRSLRLVEMNKEHLLVRCPLSGDYLDIRDKNVMTVLASSDQLFTFNSLGAKEVDAFDHNILTIYYYYLRKWSIKYNDQLYPEFVMENDYERLKKLLSLKKGFPSLFIP